MIRLSTSKDHAHSSSSSKCSCRSNGSSLDLSRLDGSGELLVLGEKFDHEALEERGLFDVTQIFVVTGTRSASPAELLQFNLS